MIGSTLLGAVVAALQLQPVLTIDPSHRIVEGVASDGETIWVSSLVDRKILACTGASCRTLVTLPAGLHPFAISWDVKRDRLWVAADCPPGVSFLKACERGAVLAYDAKGKLKTRIASASGAFHPGDVSASATGVFVSDSQSGAVYQRARLPSRRTPPGRCETTRSPVPSARSNSVRSARAFSRAQWNQESLEAPLPLTRWNESGAVRPRAASHACRSVAGSSKWGRLVIPDCRRSKPLRMGGGAPAR